MEHQRTQNGQHTKRFDHGSEPGKSPDGTDYQCVDLCPICRSADVMRTTLPPEFHEHWQALQREAALALRAALDHYISHFETERKDDPPVEDIPIG